ncbi:hypothetical protein PVL29_024706 [Vitis rotundifolia]|uniref:TMEM205-like domain-containing protein n=1 Tax=Vitis rotundifolia TaxID=103349 RepID=A0AA38YSH8_VITRO|nr:hypothetical protein PVL29_024706 [Vitis rotundifolia]
MMNGLALFLAVSSLVAAGIWSPNPDQKQKDYPGAEEVIVKEGTRVVVVEYDKEGPGNTKVSISTQEAHVFQKAPKGEDKFKEKVKEGFEVLPNMGQGLSRGQHPQNGQKPSTPKELICDAFGKCKEKMATKIGRSEQKVSEKVHEIQEGAKETLKLSQKAHDIQEEVKDAYTKTKEKVSEKSHMVQEGVKDAVEKAKHAAKPTCDLSKTIVEDVAGNISKIEAASREQMGQRGRGERQGEEKDGVDTVKSTLHEFQKKGQHDFINRVYDVVNYMLSTDAIGSLMCVIHILGFATAYGVCVWVTFFSSFVLAGALPNQQFGIVQSKIYPFYFKTMASCVGLALLGHVLSQGEKVLLGKPDLFQGHALLATLVIILINLLYLEPRATKVMFERIRVENEERKGQESSRVEPGKEGEPTTGASDPQVMGRLDQETVNNQILELNEMLKKLNAYSSFLNILTLMALKLHLVYLAHRLYMTC